MHSLFDPTLLAVATTSLLVPIVQPYSPRIAQSIATFVKMTGLLRLAEKCVEVLPRILEMIFLNAAEFIATASAANTSISFIEEETTRQIDATIKLRFWFFLLVPVLAIILGHYGLSAYHKKLETQVLIARAASETPQRLNLTPTHTAADMEML